MKGGYRVTPIARCANHACPNKPTEGGFTMVETLHQVVGGHRPLRFFLCAPCALALHGEGETR